MTAGAIEGIYITGECGARTNGRASVQAVPGRGLEGDRHFRRDKHDLTLIEAEAIEGLATERGIELAPGEPRRQLVTRGVGLNDLVGKRFRVGEVLCEGEELCHPCRHMESLTQPGVLKGLVNRGGLCARIVEGGTISVGDRVEECSPS
jgi:MOSC domain-containing protein YiiM